MKSLRLWLVVFALFSVGFSATLQAQTATSGAILGTVLDPSGAIVPNAPVALVNKDTNAKITTQTNAAGHYSFPTIAPGTYNITVSPDGFSTSTVSDVKVQVNTDSTINFSLVMGSASQVVDVNGSSAQIQLQTTDSTVGDVIGTEALAQLPTRLRQAQELTFLQPGTTPATGGDSGGSVGGAVNDQTTFTFDGIDITDNQTNSTTDTDHGARPVLMVSVEAVDEFRVGVSNSNSTFNKGAGGQVTLIGKGGSNKFHGGLFSYIQNSAFNANTWDNNHLKLAKPHVEDNRFGGYLGGPIWKDKTFFFAEYEARRYPESFQVSAIVPTATMAAGTLQFKDAAGTTNAYNLQTSKTCGTLGTAACDPRGIGISPTMKAMMAAEPAGNNPGLTGTDGLNTTGFTGNAKSPLTDDFGTFRLDHNLNSKWHLNGSFSYSRDIAYNSAPIVLDIRNPNNIVNSDLLPNWTNAFIFGATGQITPSFTENIRLGDVRNRNGALRPQLSTIAQELALPGTQAGNGYVAVSPNIFTAPITMSNTVRTQQNNDVSQQFVDDMVWSKRNHILQFGMNWQRLSLYHLHTGKVGGAVNSLNATTTADSSYLSIPAADRPQPCTTGVTKNCLPSGSLNTWDSLYASTLGLMNDNNAFVVRDGSGTAQGIGTPLIMNALGYYYSFYVQDTWRMLPSLTFTYGLSYSWQTPYNFANREESLLVDAATQKIISAKDYLHQKAASAALGTIYNPQLAFLPVANSGRSSVYNTNYDNWAPRVALAWNPSFQDGLLGKVFGASKTVIRGGFGLYYDRLNGELGVVNPGLTAGPSSTVSTGLQSCAASGTPGTGCNPNATSDPALSDFRIGVDGSIPLPQYPQKLPSPYIPADGFSELVSSGIDPYYKAPRVYSSNFTIQRDLGHGAVVEVAWTGRYGRRLESNVELNASPYMFADTGSAQTFAQAYDAVANALRAGQSVATQPWFENQLPGIGASHGYASTTAYLAATQSSNFQNGNVSSLFNSTSAGALGLNFLRKAAGLQSYDETQVNDLAVATNLGRSNYNAFIATFRRAGKNLTADVNYTYSKSLDTNQGAANDSTNLATPFNPNIDYGPSKFDRHNSFNALFIYNLPKSYSMLPRPVNKVVGGWYVSGIITAVSGLPVYVTEGAQVFGGGQRSAANTPAVPLVPVKSIHSGVHYNVAGSNGIGTSGGIGGINMFADPAAVHNDFGYVQLSSGRDGYGSPLRGMRFVNTDASIGKVIAVHNQLNLKITADAFNLFNNVTFSNATLPQLGSTVSTFGVLTSTSVPSNRQASSRWVMLGARLDF